MFRERAGDLVGIMNGADYGVWDPARGPSYRPGAIPPPLPAGKHDCKRDLQQRLALPPADAPLARDGGPPGSTRRGSTSLAGALDALLSRELQFAVLGTGDPHHEQALSGFAARHPDRMAIRIGFDEELAHAIEAGSDLFLMPSRYEPSGLNQLYSLRYGTIPVVRATGGLKDSVLPFDETTGEGTGFRFDDYSSEALVQGRGPGARLLPPASGMAAAHGERDGAGLLRGPHGGGVRGALRRPPPAHRVIAPPRTSIGTRSV